MSKIVLRIYALVYFLYTLKVPLIPHLVNFLFLRLLFGVYIGVGAKIGKGIMVGANAVITKDLPPRSLAVGVPAKVIKTNIDIAQYR